MYLADTVVKNFLIIEICFCMKYLLWTIVLFLLFNIFHVYLNSYQILGTNV